MFVWLVSVAIAYAEIVHPQSYSLLLITKKYQKAGSDPRRQSFERRITKPQKMGSISSRTSNEDSTTGSPTHTDTVDHATMMLAGTPITTNITPTTTINRSQSPAKTLQNGKAPLQKQNHFARESSIRKRGAMPNHAEIEAMFAKVLVSSVHGLFTALCCLTIYDAGVNAVTRRIMS